MTARVQHPCRSRRVENDDAGHSVTVLGVSSWSLEEANGIQPTHDSMDFLRRFAPSRMTMRK
ncbi:MAG: hypothetical protein J5977_14465 [Fibrobacter sp.]|nr:hypothetical protein [Fibrobacter sp.]